MINKKKEKVSEEFIYRKNKKKKRKLKKEDIMKKNLINKFLNIKKTGNTRIGELSDLFLHNNLNPDYLNFYLNMLYKLDKNKFKKQLLLCYPFMNVLI